MSSSNPLFNNTISPSRSVTSNQEGIHPALEETVQRHLQHSYQYPIPSYANKIFDQIEKKRQEVGGRLIFDAGCGTGLSTLNLAKEFTDDFVLGIDQSAYRLNKLKPPLPENVLLIRANLIDIWLLMEQKKWRIDQHYFLYPNPWPKKKHLQRRWYGHPVFPVILNLSCCLELRSNWKIYVDEFSKAAEQVCGIVRPVNCFSPSKTISPFEEKYLNSGQALYKYKIKIKSE